MNSQARFKLESPAFAPGEEIPRRHTCLGEDISPLLQWEGEPRATQCLALLCEDPDAPGGTFTHWMIWGIRAGLNHLPEALTVPEPMVLQDATQGENDFERLGYGGPCPPPGPPHRYYFRLYALDRWPDLPKGARKKQFWQAIQDNILDQAELMGRFGR